MSDPRLPARVYTAALAAALSLLSGCALIGSRPIVPAPVPAPVSPPVAQVPVLPLPVDNHRFVLADPSDDVVGTLEVTTASKEDTLPDIARRFNVGYEEIVRANPGVDPWIPGEGRRVVLPTRFVLPDAPRVGIIINVPAMRLFYFPAHPKGEPQVVYTHPIGIGKLGWSTPEGVTHVVQHVKDPVWHPSLALRRDHRNDNGEDLPAVVPAGPDNPLGKFEFKLGWPSYLIHGTNKPYGVGLRSSHGCVRLYPEDIEQLFGMVPDGTQVRVVNQPFLFGVHDGELYLQAYTVLEDDKRDWAHAQRTLLTRLLGKRGQSVIRGAGSSLDWQSVAAVAGAPRGVPVPVLGTGGSVDAELATAPLVQNRIPEGANWDGVDDTGTDGTSAKPLLSERDSKSARTSAVPNAAPVPNAPRG
jgi:L,D-transpeptidase ErfK/SrfK